MAKIVLGVAGGIALIGCLGVGGCVALIGYGAKKVEEQQAKVQAAVAEARTKPLTVTPDELMSAWRVNGVAADANYKDRRVRITGQVDRVSKDITDTIYVTFKNAAGGRILHVQCFFDDKHTRKADSFSPGDTVTVVGRCSGKFANVMIKDCEFVD